MDWTTLIASTVALLVGMRIGVWFANWMMNRWGW